MSSEKIRVSLKDTEKDNKEIEIARVLTTIHRPDNHCVPLLDVFPDPIDPQSSTMVTPYLRPMNNPPFGTIGEALDFIDQTLAVSLPHLPHMRHSQTIGASSFSTSTSLPIGKYTNELDIQTILL